MVSKTTRQIVFAYRPEGIPTPDIFEIREVPTPELSEGQILCRNLVVSVDPYLRLKMYDRRSYTPPLVIGQSIPGRTVAQVVRSKSRAFREGDLATLSGGWQDYSVADASSAKRVDRSAPLGAWLGPLGMTGLTAYAGLFDIGQPRPGQTLVVSGAGGAVGNLVGQIGKIVGCRVVGIAGSPEKCATVVSEFGFDACVDYKSDGFEADLAAACPNGCDVYFDNVGGSTSFSVSKLYNDFARVVVCGLISQYSGQNQADPRALDEYMRLILTRRLTIRGFIVSEIADRFPEFQERMSGWLNSGEVVFREQAYKGFDNIVPAFLSMLAGGNTGKSLVYIADPVAM